MNELEAIKQETVDALRKRVQELEKRVFDCQATIREMARINSELSMCIDSIRMALRILEGRQ